MSFRGVLAVAFGALWGKKGRNLLTMSGVTIGVFALTMIVALGQGLSSILMGEKTSRSSHDGTPTMRAQGKLAASSAGCGAKPS